MTIPQTTVRYDLTFGVPGEAKMDNPGRIVRPGLLNSASAAYNIVGATFFTSPVAGGAVAAGGAIGAANQPWGILCNPKAYAAYGTTSGPLNPTMTLPNNMEAEFMMAGELCISVPGVCSIGDLVTYNTTTGALGTIGPNASFTGVVASNVLTVSAMGATGNIGVGSVVYSSTGAILCRVLSLGTGTGGNGTYNVDTTTVSSQPCSANSAPPAGTNFVPFTTISRFPQTASGAGLAMALMANS